VTAALVIAIALVPMLEWLERRGMPSMLASALSVLLFLTSRLLRDRLNRPSRARLDRPHPGTDREGQGYARAAFRTLQRVRASSLKAYLSQIAHCAGPQQGGYHRNSQLAVGPPGDLRAARSSSRSSSRCSLIFFFLAGWTAMRKRTIVSRGSFEGALTTARVIQQVVASTSTYLGTITVINVSLGALTALILWQLGMTSPVMWGGIVAVLNYIPYLGPIVSLLAAVRGGLMVFPDAWSAMLPPLAFIGLNLLEANLITPMVVGERLEDQPAGHPHLAEFLGVGLGYDGGIARGPAADHHQAGVFSRRNARHCRIPL
jgi:hypothetical protein